MESIHTTKLSAITATPVLLFECVRKDGERDYWSTHQVTVDGQTYAGRVLRHSGFEMQTGAEDGIDGPARLTLTLANTDGRIAQIERSCGWKSARLTVRFLFYDVEKHEPASATVVMFRGIANAPDEITRAEARLSFTNRLNLQRLGLPQLRIQKRCPWVFPSTAAEREEAVAGDRYSRFHACGYSADQPGGCGNFDGGAVYSSCDYSRVSCAARGMLDTDSQGRVTRRFGGLEFVPASVLVRGHGERGRHAAAVQANEAKYSDPVPVVYGTNWYRPPTIVSRNDGNLTHIDVLLGSGVMHDVLKVLVNRVEIPRGVAGTNMTGTGWWEWVTPGTRAGRFNPAFRSEGSDPYGSLAVISVVVPNRLNDGSELPRVEVLAAGLELPIYDAQGEFAGEEFTNNPAWVLLDVLRRCGWRADEIDHGSFARAAEYCASAVATQDLHGTPASVPRFQCNLVLQGRRSAAEIVRGIRRGSGILLRYSESGRLEAVAESALPAQQSVRGECSNATQPLNGGWPVYEFGDGSNGFGDIVRRDDGQPSLRLRSRSTAETPNRFSLEFQDEFNLYQQDALSLVDAKDAVEAGQEVEGTLAATGVANFNQAARVLRLQLDKSVRGNLYAEFETGPRGIGVRPGDIVTLTSLRDGLERQPFRVLRVAPGLNFGTSNLTCQLHDDLWYSDEAEGGAGSQGGAGEARLPRPLIGTRLNEQGYGTDFEIEERASANTDGTQTISVAVAFAEPARPGGNRQHAPALSLVPDIALTGGTLPSGRDWYYAVTAVDADGNEGALSFTVHARVPEGPNTATVTLRGLSFPSGTAAMHVYRGDTPGQLMRVADGEATAAEWIDRGAAVSAAAPPDPAFHHANFYWRAEVAPECAVSSASATSIANEALALNENVLRGCVVRVVGGKAHGQERTIIANTATTLTLSPDWTVVPEVGSRFSVAESSWQFGTVALASPAVFQVPNRRGTVVQIAGVAANANDRESAMELAPVTRWEIGGAGSEDGDVPGQPTFALSTPGRGVLEVGSVAFGSLDNTNSVAAGTLTVHFIEETLRAQVAARQITAEDRRIEFDEPVQGSEGDLLVWDGEILALLETADGGKTWLVERGCLKTAAAQHTAGVLDRLRRRSFVLPFVRNFFGSSASAAWTQSLRLPNARVVAAELYVTNVAGNSETGAANYLANVDRGLRTLSGGQIALQIPGNLAIHSDALPVTTMDTSRSIRDVQAHLSGASDTHDVVVRLKRNGQAWCELTIPAGDTQCDPLPGRALAPLLEGDQIGLDVVSVGQSGLGSPGRDLSVTVRF